MALLTFYGKTAAVLNSVFNLIFTDLDRGGLLLFWLGLVLTLFISIINGVCYLWLTPTLATPPLGRGRMVPAWLVAGLQGSAYLLTLLRLPFCVLPYLAKAILYLSLGARFGGWWQALPTQALRALGDAANWGLLTLLLQGWVSNLPFWVKDLITLVIGAELVRLLLEKGQMAVSGVWQCLPHRWLALRWRAGPWRRWARRYTSYYRLSPEQRCAYLLRWLRRWPAAAADAAASVAAAKVRYVRALRLVAPTVDLRAGQVRDVARGEVFVHAQWSNDPWLIVGLILRRSPWLFDPRYLRRPFFYRTEANPRATQLVWQYALYCPPFALYQLGHELKAARFELFYRVGRWLGQAWEAPVQADGTYLFDPLLRWFGGGLGYAPSIPQHPLWSEAEVLAAARARPEIAQLSAEALAARYTFPLVYVESVLLPALRQVAANASATTSGTSQCG